MKLYLKYYQGLYFQRFLVIHQIILSVILQLNWTVEEILLVFWEGSIHLWIW